MNDKINTYSFLSWLRQGITTQIDKKEGTDGEEANGEISLRAKVDVDLQLTANGRIPSLNIPFPAVPKTVSLQDISLYGPGDVIGIQNKAVIRTEPRDRTANFEANYLPYVDFYDEDFPWRFSPAKMDGNERLIPWIVLIVLKLEEFEEGTDMHGRPLHYIKVKNTANSLPPAAETWAWAHVHVNDALEEEVVSAFSDGAKTNLKAVQAEAPDRAYARLLCPRRLEPNTTYHALVIPTFESGRLAGLGKDPEKELILENKGTGTTLAWGSSDGKKEFPYYYRWRFQTAALGDFEYLVRLLEPRPMPNEVGRRDMDVSEPGYGLPAIECNVLTEEDDTDGSETVQNLRLGGALQTPYDTMPDEEKKITDAYNRWAQPYPHDFQVDLAKFLNLGGAYGSMTVKEANQWAPEVLKPLLKSTSDREGEGKMATGKAELEEDPLITPPIYGQWHAGVERILYQPLPPQEDAIQAAAFSPHSQMVLTAGARGMARLWNTKGRLLRTYPNPTPTPTPLTTAAFSPEGLFVLTGDVAGTVFLWRRDREEAPIRQFKGHEGKIMSITSTYHNKTPFLLTCDEKNTVRLWKVGSGELQKTKHFEHKVNSIAFLPNSLVALVITEKEVKRWHIATDDEDPALYVENEKGEPVIATSADVYADNFFLTGAGDHLARLWNNNGTIEQIVDHGAPISAVRFAPGEDFFLTASAESRTIKLWKKILGKTSPPENEPISCFSVPLPQERIERMIIAPNGTQAFTVHRNNDHSDAYQGHIWSLIPNWLHELNLDPRYRVAAGYGADVIRRNQEEYMEAAWKQVGDVLAANRLLRRGRLARQTSRVWWRRIAEADDHRLLQLTAPLHRRVVLHPSDIEELAVTERTSLRSALQNSCLSPSLLSTAGRRILRPRGRLMRLAGIKATDLFREVSYGKLPAKKGKPKLTGALRLRREKGYELPQKTPFDVAIVANRIRQTIHPEKTVPVRINSRINRPPEEYPPGEDPLDDIMTYPEIDLPMYEPLTAASPDRFLPNLHLIPNNTVSLLETNQPFIESYMVGLNHEFARELLWREFPTDQRGSYFRQFWDVGTATLTETQLQEFAEKHGEDLTTMDESEKAAFLEECLKDIPEIHRWSLRSRLGEHDHRETGKTNEKELVLVIRGELLRRYPNAVVYAQEACWKDGKRERKNDAILLPLYEAKIDPDINLFGFDLKVDEAKGSPSEGADEGPGWFFVIEERPGEPRFGLDIGDKDDYPPDELENWNQLHWGIAPMDDTNQFLKAAANAPAVATPTGDSSQIEEEDTQVKWKEGTVNAAHLAYILYQVPVRVAVHAGEMLPE